MMKYNESLRDEMLEASQNLLKMVSDIEREIKKLPEGSFQKDRQKNLIIKYKKESMDYLNTIQSKGYFPKTDAVKNYLEDERQRKIKILGAYRNEEVKALSISDMKKWKEYKNFSDKIEKNIIELNKLLRVKE